MHELRASRHIQSKVEGSSGNWECPSKSNRVTINESGLDSIQIRDFDGKARSSDHQQNEGQGHESDKLAAKLGLDQRELHSESW